MKASEFITELQELIGTHGDLEIKVPYESSLDTAGVEFEKQHRLIGDIFVITFLTD
jgi:hypothetical protein